MVTATFIVLTSIEVLLYIFHFSIFVLLFAKRKQTFNGAFHNIFRMILICDLISYVDLAIVQTISLVPFIIPIFESSTFLPLFLLYLSSYVTVCQFTGHTLIAFNRFTLIWFPLKHEKIWKKQWYIVVFICLPFLNIAWKLHEPVKFVYISDDTVIIKFLNPSIASISFIVSACVYGIATFIAAILNLFAFFKLNFYKQTSSALNVKERKLLYVSFIIFGAQVLRASNIIMQVIFSSNTSIIAFLQTSLPIYNDIYALSGSITLLILSSTTRKEYFTFFYYDCFVKTSSTTTIISAPTNNSQRFPSNIT